MTTRTQTPAERTAEMRRQLPDGPGVYLFKDRRGRVLYVGKASSIRKRVGSHFSKPATRGAYEMLDQIETIDFVATETEAEALLAEQNFIRRHRPRYNIRLRDDKSYPYIGISLDEEYPRVYFTREKHRRNRSYFGPYSNAKRTRETLDLLGKVFQYRTCDGPEPGRASGSPCLDYFIKRCQAPCVGYISKDEYRENIENIIRFLSGRYRQIERDLEAAMYEASEQQEFELAANLRNRLKAVQSLLERQRISNEAVGTIDVIAGLPGPGRRSGRPPELLPDERGGTGRVRGGRGVRAPVLRDQPGDPAAGDRLARARPRARRGAGRTAERAPQRPGRSAPR
jgi:excinuclease ABC subunit C